MKKTTTLDLAALMTGYAKQVAAEEAYRKAVREGLAPAPEPLTEWAISDRD
jgi:hypothetical protein